VISALERAAAKSEADVLGLVVLASCSIIPFLILLPSLSRLLLSRTAYRLAFMPSTVELCPADAFADQQVLGCRCLVAYRFLRSPAAPAANVDSLLTGPTGPSVTFVLTRVSTWKSLVARLIAVRDRVLARLSWVRRNRL
jgi:hypothetical protein